MTVVLRGALRGAFCIAGAFAIALASTAAPSEDRSEGASELPKTLRGHPKIRDLGNGQYRIGLIDVERPQSRFRIRGRVLRLEPPLEFLAIATGGYKAYESLLELGASAYEFNLACILIGLDPQGASTPKYHFDPDPVVGNAVVLWVEWTQGEATRRVAAASLLRDEAGASPTDDWVYTGSVFAPDGQYLAQMDGTVIGFVHDPSSIIEHRTGVGLGEFGSIRPAGDVLPPVGSEIVLIVERTRQEKEGDGAKAPAPDDSD